MFPFLFVNSRTQFFFIHYLGMFICILHTSVYIHVPSHRARPTCICCAFFNAASTQTGMRQISFNPAHPGLAAESRSKSRGDPARVISQESCFFLLVLLSAYAHVLYCRVCAFQWACYLFCAIIEITDQPANQRHLAFQVQLFWVFYFLDGWTCSFWLCAGSISAELLDWFDG